MCNLLNLSPMYHIMWFSRNFVFCNTDFNIQTNYKLKQKHERYYRNWTPYIQKLILQSNINEHFAHEVNTQDK